MGDSPAATYLPPTHGWRTFLIIWVTQSISVIGSALTFFSITIWLAQVMYSNPEQKPQLALALSLIGLAEIVPNILVMPIAGAWADRHDRRRTMMIMDCISGGLSLMLMVLINTRQLQLWSLIVIYMLFTTTATFHFSAFDASYVMIVPEKRLPQANGMMQTIYSLSNVLSPAIAAFLIALPALARQGAISGPLSGWLKSLVDGTSLAIAIDAETFFLAAIVLFFLSIPSPRRVDLPDKAGDGRTAGGEKKSLWADIQVGAVYIWRRRPLLWLLGIFTVANLVTSFLVLRPMLVKYNLQADWSARGYTLETALAVVTTASGISGVLGGVFVSAWGGLKRRRVYGALAPLIVAGIAMMIHGLSTSLAFSALGAGLFMCMVPIMNSHSQAIWQTQTPRELQGRVFAVRRLIAKFTTPIGTMIAGALGGAINPGLLLAGLGAILVVFCAAQFFNPALLRVEDKAYLDGLAESGD